MNRFVIASIAFLSLIPLASAETMRHQYPVQDQVIINLTTEGWVKTDTARVSVFVDLVQQEDSADALKTKINASLDALAKGVDWRITSSSQRLDQTGLNRWYVTAEARIQEKNIAGLQDRAKDASNPGYKVGISNVDFTPSLAEFETLRSELRADVYALAVAEAARLNTVMPGQDYHVRTVNFVQQRPVMHMENARAQTMMVKSAADSGGAGASAQLLVSVKQTVSAHVVLGRTEQALQK